MNIEEIFASMRERDIVRCPHCKKVVAMDECEVFAPHVSYWGDETRAIDCPSCNVEFFLAEHVTRTWTAGRTPSEAEEL